LLIFAFYTVFFASVFNSKKCHLFSDAEVFEDIGEDGVGGDFATGDFGKVVEALAEVFGDEVARDVISYGMTYTGNGFEGMMQGFVMTEVGDDGGVVALIYRQNLMGSTYQGTQENGHSCTCH
jgi:hypothetical protein